MNQHHEVCYDGAEHASEQVQRNGEEFCAGNCHRLLALLANDLHERFGLFRAIVPVAGVGRLHDRRTLFRLVKSYWGTLSIDPTHLFNQPVAEDAEQEHLSQCIHQVADNAERVNINAFDLRGLIGQQGQHNCRCEHVEQQRQTVRVADGRDESVKVSPLINLLCPVEVRADHNSPDNVLMSFDPVLNGTSHHQLLLLRQTVGIVEVLQCRRRTVLCSPVGLGIVNRADVQVVVRVFLVFWCDKEKVCW